MAGLLAELGETPQSLKIDCPISRTPPSPSLPPPPFILSPSLCPLCSLLSHTTTPCTPVCTSVLELIPMWQKPNIACNDSVTSAAHVLHKRLWRKHEWFAPAHKVVRKL